jgi:hypothetical protein
MSDPKLGSVVKEAMQLWDQLKANGASLAERQAGLENVIRAHWPRGREWHYLCASCDDVGLVMADCPGDATCGRTKAHGPHTFGTGCWCAKGEGYRRPPKPAPEDFAAAGKTRGGWSKAGR